MSQRTCHTCPAPVYNSRVLCKSCERDLRERLTNQAALYDDLETELTRQARKQPQAEAGKSANTPMPVDLDAAALIARQRTLLVAWVREVHPLTQAEWPADSVPAMSVFLEAHLDLLRKSEDMGQMALDFRSLVWAITRYIDNPEKREAHVGPCCEKYDHPSGGQEWCPGEVRAVIWAEEGKPPEAYCTACKASWPSWQWVQMERRIAARVEQEKRAKEMAETMIKRGA